MKKAVIISFLFLTIQAFGQVNKIKVKKDEPQSSDYKNDTCNFKISIDKDIYGKKLILHSIDVDDNSEKGVALTNSFRSVVLYIGTSIDIKPLSIQAIFLEVCKINNFRLRTINVKRHESKNPAFQNRIDISLTYTK